MGVTAQVSGLQPWCKRRRQGRHWKPGAPGEVGKARRPGTAGFLPRKDTGWRRQVNRQVKVT